MSFSKKLFWFLLGFASFFIAFVGIAVATVYVPFTYAKWGGIIFICLIWIMPFAFEKQYASLEEFIAKSNGLYYLFSGLGSAFLLVILAFVAFITYGLLAT